ncbi:MAG TPA: translation initiation factor IF-2 [Candidatus Hydrogenedentes bacterium]|nr:translation initiation factor IF-2 [Candidatus Hydrogenedentota bacterium]
MQTIAGLATRLDMSAEEAVETLRKLRCNIEGVESLITNEQMDMLIQIDEDPMVLERLLEDMAKKDDRDRKRNERLQQAAKRAAAKRKAEKEEEKRKEEEKKAAEKEQEVKAPKKKTSRKKVKKEAEAPVETVVEESVVVPEQAEVEETVPHAIIQEEEAPPAKPKAVAEILKEEPKSRTGKPRRGALEEKPAIIIGAAVETKEPLVEIVRADGTVTTAAELDILEHEPLGILDEEPEVKGVLAEAERQQEEEERRRAKQKASKPLPVPDPAVVAEVIRKAHERSRQKGAKASVAVRPETIDKDLLFRGEGKKSGKTAKKRQKRAEKARLIEENLRRDAAAAVREYQSGGTFGMARRKKRKRTREESGEISEEEQGGVIEVAGAMTVEQLATAMEVPVNEVILMLMDENILVTKNQTIELDMIRKIAESQGFDVEVVIPEEEDLLTEEPDNPDDLQLRPPVITVMGHVDHGKTSLLDRVRSANVAAGEAGGITQHIAAYDVEMSSGRVVFLDTPGHEAFTHMRARGAKVTDVVVLVVAADDGVRPQTLEALDHAKAAEVPVVVAINKCDKPDAQPDRVRQELSQYGLLSEEWGGKTIMRDISAKTGMGIDELLEMLVLASQMLELKANPNKHARGAVIESEISRGQGPVAWVLVQSGTLHVGDVFLCGKTYGRVRTMTNSRGKSLMEAGPSTPVLVTGFNAFADAGDIFVVTSDERAARSVAEKRMALSKLKRGPAVQHMTLEDFHARMLAGEQKTLNVIIKADVQGSVDVLQSSLEKIGNEEVSIQIVHGGVGGINESDILLASASDSVIIGFHITANPRAQKLAEQEGVEIRTYRVIYEAIDEIKHALEGLLAPESKESVSGHAEVRQVFRSSALGNIAGCFQLDGETQRGSQARLIRDEVVVHDGRIASVRRGKDDVRSVQAGFECGIKLEKYEDIQVGDIIESYRMEQVAKTLN